MNNSPIVDPLSRLPIETFTHLFPFLPIFDIAKSSAVSRNWREAILSDSTLHQEVDLTRLKSEDTRVILVHLERLSSRSLHRLVKVSLNLTAFNREYLGGKLKAGNASDSLVRSLSRSRDTLKRISLKIDGDGEDRFGYLASYFLDPILKLPSLQMVYLQLNQFIEFQVGEVLPSSKVFLVNIYRSFEEELDEDPDMETSDDENEMFDKIFEVIEAATAFVGSGLTKLNLDWNWITAPDDRFDSDCTIDLIRTHSFNLKELTIELPLLNSDEKRNLIGSAASCPELTHLSIIFPKDDEESEDEVDDEAGPLTLPEGVRCLNLKELDLEPNLRLDWESLSRWCGNSLERLRISTGSITSASPASFIFKSSSTLKKLDLVFSEGEAEGTFSGPLPSIPNLSRLSLKKASSSSLKLFSNLDVNRLYSLTICASEDTKADAFNCLYSLLKRYAKNLGTLMLDNIGYEESSSPMSGVNFNELFSLRLDSCHPNLFEWLSTLSYPDLRYLRSTGSAESDEAKARFKMNAPKVTEWTFQKLESPPF